MTMYLALALYHLRLSMMVIRGRVWRWKNTGSAAAEPRISAGRPIEHLPLDGRFVIVHDMA